MDYNVLLHPYRFLVASTLNNCQASVKELKFKLPEIPQAALYRSVNTLLDAGIIKISSSKKQRSTLEHTYTLNTSLSHLSPNELDKEQMELASFMMYFTHVLRLIQPPFELHRYNTSEIKINANDIPSLAQDLSQLIKKYHDPEGRAFQLTTFLQPKGE